MDIKFLNNLNRTDSYVPLQGDITFAVDQDVTTISDLEYIDQQYAKVFVSPVGSDPYFPGFGTAIPFLLFTDPTLSVIQNEIVNGILGGIAYMLQLETSNSITELPTGVDDIKIAEATTGSERGVTVTVTLTVASGQQTVVLLRSGA